jgi:mycothiol synthase
MNQPDSAFTFRPLRGKDDYLPMLAVARGSNEADGFDLSSTIEDIERVCTPAENYDPTRDVLLTLAASAEGNGPFVIGYSRVGWYSGLEDTRLYWQVSFLLPEWRGRGVWPAMVEQNERRLREIAAGHPSTTRRLFQGWANDKQRDWIEVLERQGYQAVRYFFNMLHRLEEISDRPLPPGLEVRPVRAEHFRSIWEVQKEETRDLFETVAEDWTEDKYPAWRENPAHTPELWQVAWDGDQVAGMVLARIDAVENEELGRKRGYTEHIFVRRAWRNLGLASALIASSLRVLKVHGMDEAELGVDSENKSGALGLYQKMGYQTFSTDTWFRKPMA